MPCVYSDIIVSPEHLWFTAKEGYEFIPYQYLELKKATNDQSTSWSLTADTNWVRYRPNEGYGPKSIRVNAKTGMPVGTYQANLKIESTAAIVRPSVVAITLEVKPESEPEPAPGPGPGPGPGPEPTEPEPKPSEPEPPVEPPESWWSRFLKWLLGLFGGA
jgi:hypothetical protein